MIPFSSVPGNGVSFGVVPVLGVRTQQAGSGWAGPLLRRPRPRQPSRHPRPSRRCIQPGSAEDFRVNVGDTVHFALDRVQCRG